MTQSDLPVDERDFPYMNLQEVCQMTGLSSADVVKTFGEGKWFAPDNEPLQLAPDSAAACLRRVLDCVERNWPKLSQDLTEEEEARCLRDWSLLDYHAVWLESICVRPLELESDAGSSDDPNNG